MGLVDKPPLRRRAEELPLLGRHDRPSGGDGLPGHRDDPGLATYRFVATVEDEPVDVVEGVPGTYSNVVTVNVDPVTGWIVKGGQDQQRYLDDGTQVLDVDITWTAETIANAMHEAKANGESLNLVLKVVPIVGFVVGGLALVGGLFLILRQTEPAGRRVAPQDETTAPANV